MKHHKARRTALLALALAFLAVVWVWDGLTALARLVVRHIPWSRVKRALVALVDRLPAPLLFVATIAVAMGYVVLGAIAWIVLKLLAISVIPAIFDLTEHRLMTMPWFVWAYRKVMAWRHYAHRIVAPYKHAAAALVRQWRRKAAALMGRTPGVAQLAVRVARRRVANGRAAARLNRS
jgi:hypothetical protein